jgi:hypothetical protein
MSSTFGRNFGQAGSRSAKFFAAHGTPWSSNESAPGARNAKLQGNAATACHSGRCIRRTQNRLSSRRWGHRCKELELALGVQGLIGGVGGSSVATLAFQIGAWLEGRDYSCRLQADFAGSERILSRDVLNRLEVLFRGPVGEVVVNPG